MKKIHILLRIILIIILLTIIPFVKSCTSSSYITIETQGFPFSYLEFEKTQEFKLIPKHAFSFINKKQSEIIRNNLKNKGILNENYQIDQYSNIYDERLNLGLDKSLKIYDRTIRKILYDYQQNKSSYNLLEEYISISDSGIKLYPGYNILNFNALLLILNIIILSALICFLLIKHKKVAMTLLSWKFILLNIGIALLFKITNTFIFAILSLILGIIFLPLLYILPFLSSFFNNYMIDIFSRILFLIIVMIYLGIFHEDTFDENK